MLPLVVVGDLFLSVVKLAVVFVLRASVFIGVLLLVECICIAQDSSLLWTPLGRRL